MGGLSRESGLAKIHKYVEDYAGGSFPPSVAWQLAAYVQELYRVASISPEEFGLYIESPGPSLPQPLMRMYRGEQGVKTMLNEFGGVGALELGRASIEGDQWVREVKSGFLGLGRRTISGHMSTLYDLFVVTRSSITLTANQLRIYKPAPTNIVLAYQGERAGSRRVVDMAVRPRDIHDGGLDTCLWVSAYNLLDASQQESNSW